MFCNNCGLETPDQSKFCMNCGVSIPPTKPNIFFLFYRRSYSAVSEITWNLNEGSYYLYDIVLKKLENHYDTRHYERLEKSLNISKRGLNYSVERCLGEYTQTYYECIMETITENGY